MYTFNITREEQKEIELVERIQHHLELAEAGISSEEDNKKFWKFHVPTLKAAMEMIQNIGTARMLCGGRPHKRDSRFQIHRHGRRIFYVNHSCAGPLDMLDAVVDLLDNGKAGTVDEALRYLAHGHVRIVSGVPKKAMNALKKRVAEYE